MRIVTRGDMDGLVGSVIVSLHESIDDILLIHPQDITDDRVEIRLDDILINVPYHRNCAMWFDHDHHTASDQPPPDAFLGSSGAAPSAARLVYEFYGGAEALPQFERLVEQTDRMDSADLKPGDVVSPQGYIKMGFTIDSRTGHGAFEEYFLTLLNLLREAPPAKEVLAHPEVATRCEAMKAQRPLFKKALEDHSRVEGQVVVTDFRSLTTIPLGNRFLVYVVFPQANVSIRLHWGPRSETVVAVIGHSIFNRSCRVDVGRLAASYGGGGLRGAGSLPLDPVTADQTLQTLIAELQKDD